MIFVVTQISIEKCLLRIIRAAIINIFCQAGSIARHVTLMGWIAVKVGPGIYGFQMMDPNDCGDPVSVFSMKCLHQYWIKFGADTPVPLAAMHSNFL